MYCFSGFLEQNRPPCSRKREIDGGFGILDEKSDQSMFSILQQLSSCMVRQTRRISSSWPPGSDLGTSRISSPAPKQANGWNRCWNSIASQKTDFGGAQFKGGKHGTQIGQTACIVLCLGPPGKNSNSAKNPKKPAVGAMPQALGKSIDVSVSRKPWTNAMTWIKSKSLRF